LLGVPVEECVACGQVWLTMDVAKRLDALFKHWREAPLAEVKAEFLRLVAQLQLAVGTKSDEEMRSAHTLSWAPPGSLWEFVGRDTFLVEWPTHRDQMERARQNIDNSLPPTVDL
jgi:hypothetical protein